MTVRHGLAGLACGLVLFAASAHAWNATGHRLVAGIAWERMTPPARAEASRLLQAHPDYARWLRKAQEGDVDRQVFIAASTWADEIRKDKRFYTPGGEEATPGLPGFPDMRRHSDWHYEARPLDAATATAPHRPSHLGMIGEALSAQARVLGDRRSSAVDRQYALPWIVHLVGDAHQPLHLTLRLDSSGNWDKLGNLLVINLFNPRKPSMTLHAFWDDLAGHAGLRGTALDQEVLTLLTRHPDAPRHSVSSAWLDESWELARQYGYPEGNAAIPEIDASFFARSRDIAERRVVEAGYRLGEWLSELLGRLDQ